MFLPADYSEISGHDFTQVGNSLVRYGNEEVSYLSAKKRCVEVFKANMVEFRNEQEWLEVTFKAGYLYCA